MKFQPYEAHLIPSDLRHDECILQVADSLDHLSRVANTILDGLQERMNEYKGRLQSVQARADLARAKISVVRGSSKATKVFSSYKYPAGDPEAGRQLLASLPAVPFQPSRLHVKSQHVAPDERLLKEKLQFFNVRPPTKPDSAAAAKAARQNEEEEGLGRLPDSIDSVGSLLLFNTGENPYTRYVQRDPLGGTKRTAARAGEEEASPGLLGAAPVSMSGANQQSAPQEGFLYSPGMGQVPQMDVPSALPHLPGIADDLSYSEDLGPSIAPSWLPELPEVPTDSSADVPPPLLEAGTPGLLSLDAVPDPVIEVPPPLELPQPQPDELPQPQPNQAAHSHSTTEAAEESTRSSNPEAHEEVTPPVPEDGSARASLLDSIRKVGGKAGLKSARRPQQQRKQAPPPGCNLMDDLRNKLQLRRKGISGEMDRASRPAPSSSEVTSPLDRVLEMIPPPKVDSEEASTTDTEWNDSD